MRGGRPPETSPDFWVVKPISLWVPSHNGLMLDAPQPGSGQPLDWAALVPHFPPGSWLAGGLGPDNVAQAIATLRPAGVDAVSRLEASPGLKNPQAVEAFIDAVKRS